MKYLIVATSAFEPDATGRSYTSDLTLQYIHRLAAFQTVLLSADVIIRENDEPVFYALLDQPSDRSYSLDLLLLH